MDQQQFLQECAKLIGQSIRLMNPLLSEEAQHAIALRIAKKLLQDSSLEARIIASYRTAS